MSDDALHWTTPEERVSRRVFTVTLGLILIALRWPELPPEWLQGVLWAGMGLLMLLIPPRVRVPWAWALLALGFVLCSSLGFLPRAWFHIPAWRTDLEALGLDTGPHAFVQVRLAAETLLGQAITASVVVYLLGHRVAQRHHHELAIAFTLGVAIIAAWAMAAHEKGATFGFFPNRNHTACLLAVASIMGLGSFVQAVRQKAPWKIGLSAIGTAVILCALLAFSESRAGIVLLGIGFAALVPLMGRQYIRGHAGKAIVLAIGTAIAAFFIADSRVKTRLADTVEKLKATESAATETPDSPFEATPQPAESLPIDGRISIYQDTLAMIQSEPWTGVGPWQFQYVFPQYRVKSGEPNDAICRHPESNWLWLAAESGLPATLCLLAALVAAATAALRGAWYGRARALRMGSIIAALLVPIHGMFDVPGQRIGIAWAAAMLLAAAFRYPSNPEKLAAIESPLPLRWLWRGLGLLLLASGTLLLHATLTGQPMLTAAKTARIMADVKALYDQDQAAYDLAQKENRTYDPPPQEDPLESAISLTKDTIRLLPLESHHHYVLGNLALHYDNKPAIVDQAFAIHLRLAPARIGTPLLEARASRDSDPARAQRCWEEAIQRAEALENSYPAAPSGIAYTYRRILHDAASAPLHAAFTLQLARQRPKLLPHWAGSAPPSALDAAMPDLLSAPLPDPIHTELQQIWRKRSPHAAQPPATSVPNGSATH